MHWKTPGGSVLRGEPRVGLRIAMFRVGMDTQEDCQVEGRVESVDLGQTGWRLDSGADATPRPGVPAPGSRSP